MCIYIALLYSDIYLYWLRPQGEAARRIYILYIHLYILLITSDSPQVATEEAARRRRIGRRAAQRVALDRDDDDDHEAGASPWGFKPS
jgi:hypothetical protein